VISKLYAITDDRLMPGDQLFSKTKAVLDGGCRLIQYRSKQDSLSSKTQNALRLKTICDDYNATLIINDDVEIALTVSAHGVHLGQNDSDLSVARSSLGKEVIIGATCHDSVDLAMSAYQNGASYLAFGRFFSSMTKPEAKPAAIGILRNAQEKTQLPIVAIGGINLKNAPSLIDAGADCLAVCNDLFQFNDLNTIQKQAEHYLSLFELSPFKDQDQQ